MRNTVIWSFLSLVALATGAFVTGCDSDAKLVRSSAGESCDKTSDCDDDLHCVEHTCYKTVVSAGGSANNGGGEPSTGGTVPTGPKPPVLGGPGESCAKRADCEDGLACLAMRCTEDGAGMGGGGTAGPTLGGPGETCGLTSDCADGLACLPSDGISNVEAKAIGSNSVGVCSTIDNGLTATGNACGAECKTADDCCELPVSVHIANATAPTYGVGVKSCAELTAVLDGVNCDAATLTTQNAARCFAMTAYCTCAKNTWACSEVGKCVYNAACTSDYATPGGCPTYTRAGSAATAVCDIDGSKKCQLPAAVPSCKADTDCDKGEVIADTGEVCKTGECTCYKETKLCYRKCGEDLDCAAGKTCNTKTKVCVQGPECTNNAYCVTKYNDIKRSCSADGVCERACDNDRDCNAGMLTLSGSTSVCNADHICQLVGCASDADCINMPGPGGVKLFCGPVAKTVAVGGVSSAITD